jgi:hypothetical protein
LAKGLALLDSGQRVINRHIVSLRFSFAHFDETAELGLSEA